MIMTACDGCGKLSPDRDMIYIENDWIKVKIYNKTFNSWDEKIYCLECLGLEGKAHKGIRIDYRNPIRKVLEFLGYTEPRTVVREEVTWFSKIMEQKLKENEHKGGWRDCTIPDLLRWLRGEVTEIENAIAEMDCEEIQRECADVANYAMMIADKFKR